LPIGYPPPVTSGKLEDFKQAQTENGRQTVMARVSVDRLKDRVDELESENEALQDENESLQERLESIVDIASEEEDEDEGED
jgi:hypothetical protein